MRYNLNCYECVKNKSNNFNFTVKVSPNNEGLYNIECPNGHKFKIDILSHHFQVLFENGIHALSDDYLIESFVSFTASYERFIEYFLRLVSISNGTKKSNFDETWKELAKQSERQIGAFYLVYLQEFKEKPNQLSNSNRELRNNVIHKGYLPTVDDCIKYGNNVLEFIRAIILKLKNEDKYEFEMLSSVNYTGNFDNNHNNINLHYLPYQIFAINRGINQTDKKSLIEFLKDEKELKKKSLT